jgi:hypothetical protein
MWRGFAVAAAALVVLVGCATTPPATQGTQLYLAVELKEDGVVVGAPQLLGFAGKSVTVERRKPGAATADYKLELSPRGDSAGYRLGVQLDVRGRHGKGELGLLHGEERSLKLERNLELKVLLLEVDSPEFQAWVATLPRAPGLI